MASIDNALTTLARAKSFMDITVSSKDLVLTMLILAASRYVEDTHCRRKFKRQTFTNELYNGNGSPRLYIKNGPVIQGQTFTLQERKGIDADNDWQTIDSDKFYIAYDTGMVTLVGGKFYKGTQNYRVTYTGGYYLPSSTAEFQDGTDDDQDLPYDLELAVLDLVKEMYNQRQYSGITREKVGQVEVSYAESAAQAPHIKNSLDKYKKMNYA